MTEAKAVRAAPRLQVSPLELRLYLVAALAGVYALVWLLVWRASGASPAVAASAAPAPSPPPGTAVWIDELPQAQRPAVTPPAGWRLASRGELVVPATRIVRAPVSRVSRPVRLRTRSS